MPKMTHLDKDLLIERLFTLLRLTDEWDDGDIDEELEKWRGSRGDAAKGGWEWWAREVDCGEPYSIVARRDNQTRGGIIAAVRSARQTKEIDPESDVEIIEARYWADEIEGDEEVPFAETRNHEILRGAAND